MAREHREKHKAHLDAHIRDANGEYHYVGEWFAVDGGRRALLPFTIRCALTAAAVIAAGCVDFPGMRNTAYVILPYLLSVCALFALLWNAVRLVSGGGRLKAYVWDKVQGSFLQICVLLAITAGLTIALGAAYLLTHRTELPGTAAAFFALMGAAIVCALMTRKAYSRQVWEKE